MKNDMRTALTKRMFREGLLSLIEKKPFSRITVTDLCSVSGVNRATFYNHYESVPMVLREIVWEYAEKIEQIYRSEIQASHTAEKACVSCLTYLHGKKQEISILFSKNTESYISGFGHEVVNDFIRRNRYELKKRIRGSDDEVYLCLMTTASGAYGLILTWLINDMKQTPEEITSILRRLFSIQSFYA